MEHEVTKNKPDRAFQFTERDTIQDVLDFVNRNVELYNIHFSVVTIKGIQNIQYFYLGNDATEYGRKYFLDDGDWIVCVNDGGIVLSEEGFKSAYHIIKD